MRYPKIIVLFLATLLVSQTVRAQIDLSKYYDEGTVPLVDVEDHLDPGFVWNMPGKIQVYLNEGINFLKEGELGLAVTNLDQALELDPKLWVAHYYRGVCHKMLNDFKAAETDLSMSIKLCDTLAVGHVELGEIYHLKNLFDKAAEHYNKAIDIDPQLTLAYYNLGSLALARGDMKKSLRYYEKCDEVDPKFPQAYMMQGLMKFKARNKDNEAIRLFDRALAADSTFALTYFWRGLACVALDRFDEGLDNWTSLLTLAPHNPFYTFMRGFLLIEMGDYDNAFNDLRKAMKSIAVDDEKFVGGQTVLDKKIDLQFAANYLITNGYGLDENSFTLLKKGYCLLVAGKPRIALQEIKKAENIQPSATVFFLEAIAYEHSGDHNSSFKHYTKALEKDNDNFDAHKKRSVYRVELKDWKGANDDFNHMFRLQPNSPTTYRIRGLARSLQHDYAGAIEDLSNFIKTDSSDYEAIRTRSVCLELVGDKAGANEDLRRLLDFNAESDIFEEVTVNYLNSRDTAKAIAVLHKYSESWPYSTTPHMELARIYISQKKWDNLKVEIAKLLFLIHENDQSREYSEVVFWDGLIDFERSSYEVAISKFSKSLRSDANNLRAKYFRAKAYAKVGEVKKALAEFKELAKLGYSDSGHLYETALSRVE